MKLQQISRRLFVPILPGATLRDRMIGCLGAMLGIGLTGLLGYATLGINHALPFLVAPMGASAVLLFAVPASPLAQPWSIIGGNTLGALSGVAAATLIHDPLLASAVAVAAAIAIMSFTRCLHPPGGAAALIAVLGGPSILAAGYSFAFLPVAVNSTALVALGWLFHKFTRHHYPHRHAAPVNLHGAGDPPPQIRIGFDTRDIDAVLAETGETFDIDREDLDELLRKIELRALARKNGEPTCADIMSRDLIHITGETGLQSARRLMLSHGIRSLPVVDAARQLKGIVTLREVAAGAGRVEDAMAQAMEAAPDSPAFDLIPKLSDGACHAAVIIDERRRIIGMVTQTDLLAALSRRPERDKAVSG